MSSTKISSTIYPFTLQQIFAIYWGAPCKYLKNGEWKYGRVNADMFKYIDKRECILLLKPIQYITVEEVVKLEHLSRKVKKAAGEEVEPQAGLNDEQKKELRENFIDNEYVGMDFTIADALRKSGYHVPVYGLHLFKANIAKNYNPPPKTKEEKKEEPSIDEVEVAPKAKPIELPKSTANWDMTIDESPKRVLNETLPDTDSVLTEDEDADLRL